jgi:hypothetical protein
MCRFRSKRDPLSYLLLLLPTLVVLSIVILSVIRHNWSLVIPLLIASGISFWIWTATYYEFLPDELLVKAGPFKWKISYQSIKRVRRTKSLLSSPALSINRLEISHTKGIILISPEKELEFISLLMKQNPEILIEIDGSK